ncbi:MAG TPA: hypothetical protein VFR84_02650 [Candidatus Angelobacter sp.]|nr:hypothetical protein [Candidatus Angelobacter sp.]
MRTRFLLLLFVLAPALAGFAQHPQRVSPPSYPAQYRTPADYLRAANVGHYPGSQFDTPFANGQSSDTIAEMARRRAEAQANHDAYVEYLERQRRRQADQERADAEERALSEMQQPRAQANPDAPDQSELLKNAKDPDFILRNFRTMYVDAHAAQYFGSDQMKAALGKNREFQKLGIHMVDDPRVADVVLKVSYTFAWDYPFELRHQNTTVVLLAGKGEGPLSGPLGAADVARRFVQAAKPWREKAVSK